MYADESRLAVAFAAHTHCFADLPIADAYSLSAEEACRRGLPKRTEDTDLTYGDVPLLAIAHALAAANPRPGTIFYDLGSGVGRGVIAAALLHDFEHCIGIELLSDLHKASAEPSRRFEALRNGSQDAGIDLESISSPVTFFNADLFDCNLFEDALRRRPQLRQTNDPNITAAAGVASHAALEVDILVFVCCVTWGSQLMQRLASKLAEELPDGSKVITVGQRLPETVDLLPTEGGKDRGAVRFDEAWRGVEPFEWGKEVVVVHQTVRVGVLAARRLRKAALAKVKR